MSSVADPRSSLSGLDRSEEFGERDRVANFVTRYETSVLLVYRRFVRPQPGTPTMLMAHTSVLVPASLMVHNTSKYLKVSAP